MATVTVKVADDEIVEMASRLSTAAKRRLLGILIPDMDRFEDVVDYGEEQVRKVAASRGGDWDGLTPAQREELVDQILHEP